MARDVYRHELKKILDNREPIPTIRSRAQMEADIAEISTRLKGHLGNVERLMLIEDRQFLRNQLASLI